ncbi:hypothetical protein EYS14_18205 [Alteromonadaceae bacterium M269]|nr:hypothetical protein EYS14_18205 [Alteromonadaceae bacterium M269]
MIKLPLKIATIFSFIAFVSLAAATVSAKNNVSMLACSCTAGVELNLSLPMSHPINRCAENNATNDVSWFAWLSGKTKSNQFHYLDLLELLSRYTESGNNKHS